jgi:YebC/PmpR family DNA-binding regulatory protein
MAGHSKWKNIKHAKAATDAKRGAVFTKLIREITVAAKAGGGDPGGNPRLRTAIDAARSLSMPKDNIDRAVKKGTGDLEGVDYVEITYEAYGPGGVALMIQALTDNPTRTVADVRAKLTRNNGNLGTAGSVAFMFDRRGRIYMPATGDEDAMMEMALDCGASDFANEDGTFAITTELSELHTVKEALEAKGMKIGEAKLEWLPQSTVHVTGDDARSLVKLLDVLEDLDDVQNVEGNFDIDASALDD